MSDDDLESEAHRTEEEPPLWVVELIDELETAGSWADCSHEQFAYEDAAQMVRDCYPGEVER